MLRSHGANLHDRVKPFSNLLGSSALTTHVNVVSVSSTAVYPSAQALPRASPKVKEEQPKPFPGSSAKSARLRPDKTLHKELNDGVSLTRKPLDPYDPTEDVTRHRLNKRNDRILGKQFCPDHGSQRDVTSTDASPSEQEEEEDSGKTILSRSWLTTRCDID